MRLTSKLYLNSIQKQNNQIMKSSSNPFEILPPVDEGLQYPYPSHVYVQNFVSVKLAGNENYHLWKEQMLCLFESHEMLGFIDGKFENPRSSAAGRRSDSLVRGWILGSLREDVLGTVVGLRSAKDVWTKLEFFYDLTNILQDSTKRKTEIQMKADTREDEREKKKHYQKLLKATMRGYEWKMEAILKKDRDAATVPYVTDGNSDDNTVLHIAVGTGRNRHFLRKLLEFIEHDKLVKMRNSNGSTALHIAASVGNKDAAVLLVAKNKVLLETKDDNGYIPLVRAFYSMQVDTFLYLLSVTNNYKDNNNEANLEQQCPSPKFYDDVFDSETGVELLVNAISAKQFDLALELVEIYPRLASKNDAVLVAIAKNFPNALNVWETATYPYLSRTGELILKECGELFSLVRKLFAAIPEIVKDLCKLKSHTKRIGTCSLMLPSLLIVFAFYFVYHLAYLFILAIYFPFFMIYFLLWKAVAAVVPPIKHIEHKRKEHGEAKKFLRVVCERIGTHHPYYNKPILEAARQNAYEVVEEILLRSPRAIRSKSEEGYDIIQLSIIHRSERIYNLIYSMGEHRNFYRTFKDSSENNILHLVGRLAPPHKLNHIPGAALQIQRELQWRQEVKKLVFPTYIKQENIYKETPDMVFMREHKALVKEGEGWIKDTANSCTITATLITTIVFAAAITVPGGSTQDSGTPIFIHEIPFTVFAISDAISLFTSATSLLMFLSILTARFAEQDFLVSLPRRLIIGLFTLFLSNCSMMVAFSAALLIVFGQKRAWILFPIAVSTFLPIASFVTLQFPLLIDLIWSTYGNIFGKRGTRLFY